MQEQPRLQGVAVEAAAPQSPGRSLPEARRTKPALTPGAARGGPILPLCGRKDAPDPTSLLPSAPRPGEADVGVQKVS